MPGGREMALAGVGGWRGGGGLTTVSGRSCQGQRVRTGGKGDSVSRWRLPWGRVLGGRQVGWKPQGEPPSSDLSPFSAPRFPYRVCLRSHPLRLSLSAWKPCSATSGSCSILRGSGSWPRSGWLAGPEAKADRPQTGLERHQQSSPVP